MGYRARQSGGDTRGNHGTARGTRLSAPFWSNPPWADGNGHYQMGLRPVAPGLWCPRLATAQERSNKLNLLRSHFSSVVQTTSHSQQAQTLLAAELNRRYPNANPVETSALPKLGNSRDLVEAALSVPEDLCLLELRDNEYVLVAACVCAPSYWHLPEKIGLTLRGVHDPVPELNTTLGQRMQDFFVGLPEHRVFMRRNWFLHASDDLYQPQPDQRTLVQTAEQALELTVRSETQTLRRLSSKVVVFTIAVECQPLSEIRSYPEAARSLLNALHNRTAAEQAAAGQEMYLDGVVALLESVAER